MTGSATSSPDRDAVDEVGGGLDGSLVRSGTHTLAISVLAVAIGLAMSVVVARGAGPEGKGGYDLMLATTGLLVIVFGLSLPGGITYGVATTGIVSARLVIACGGIALVQGIAAAATIAVILRTPYASAFVPPAVGGAAAVSIGILTGSLLMAAYLRAILLGRRRIAAANWTDLVSRLLALGAVVLGAAAIVRGAVDPSSSSILLVWCAVGATVATVILSAAVVRPDVDRRGLMHVRPIAGFAAPSYLANLAQFLNYRLDLFFVGFFLGAAPVGLYALSSTLAQLIWLLGTSAATPLLPHIATAPHDTAANARDAAHLTRIVAGASAAAAAVMALTAGVLVPLVYGSDFAGSVGPLLLLLPGIVALSPAKVLAGYLAGAGHARLNLIASAAGLPVTICLDLALIPTWGIAGAAIASTAAYIAERRADLRPLPQDHGGGAHVAHRADAR